MNFGFPLRRSGSSGWAWAWATAVDVPMDQPRLFFRIPLLQKLSQRVPACWFSLLFTFSFLDEGSTWSRSNWSPIDCSWWERMFIHCTNLWSVVRSRCDLFLIHIAVGVGKRTCLEHARTLEHSMFTSDKFAYHHESEFVPFPASRTRSWP